MIIIFSKQILVLLFGAELSQYSFLVVYLSMTIPIILLKYAPEYGLRTIGNTKPIFIGYLLTSIISVIFSKIVIENYQLQGFIFGMFLSPIILSTVAGLGFLKNFKKIKWIIIYKDMSAHIRNFLIKFTIIRVYIIKIKFFFNINFPKDFKIINKLSINTAVDVGSNKGIYTYYFSKNSNKIYSFEPILSLYNTCKKLVKNIKNTEFSLNNYALGNENKDETLNIPLFDDAQSSIVKKSEKQKTITIKVKIGDEVLDNVICDFVKIDVEGYEYKTIQGFARQIAKNHPVFLVEIEKRHNPEYQKTFGYFKSLNYDVFYQKNSLLKKITTDIKGFIEGNQDETIIGKDEYVNNFWFISEKSILFNQMKEKKLFID